MPSKSILIIDGEDILRDVLTKELLEVGYDVKNTPDGDNAIDILNREEFDVVILELKLPTRVSGFDVITDIKRRGISTKILVLTRQADLANAINSKKLGADDFISKPYDFFDLVNTIERVIKEE